MRRVVRVLAPIGDRVPVDSLLLSAEYRRVQSVRFTGVNGTPIGLMLPEPVLLRHGDLLEFDDGSVVDVVAEPEPLIEIRGNDLTHLARLAWHLGDRHIPAELHERRVRVRRDAATETLLNALASILGAKVLLIEAPFEPEGGAYSSHGHAAHSHSHAPAPAREQGFRPYAPEHFAERNKDHTHDHEHGHGHDHSHGHGHEDGHRH